MKRRRRHPRERTVVFPWEARASSLAWLSRRHAGRVLALLLGVVGVWQLVSLNERERKIHSTRAAVRSVMLATEAFRADHGRCPSSLDELVHPPETVGVSGRYLAELRLDGWGRPLRLRCPGRKHPSSADVVSEGPEHGLLPPETIE